MEMRDRLRSAILSGRLAETDRLNERGDTVADILGIDSLDLLELVMAAEEKGIKGDTVGDLMRFLDEMPHLW
jgi:acyl carrier protein